MKNAINRNLILRKWSIREEFQYCLLFCHKFAVDHVAFKPLLGIRMVNKLVDCLGSSAEYPDNIPPGPESLLH